MSARRGQKGTKATSIRKGQANKKEVVVNTYSTAHRKEGTYNDLKQESVAKQNQSHLS